MLPSHGWLSCIHVAISSEGAEYIGYQTKFDPKTHLRCIQACQMKGIFLVEEM